MPDKSEFLTRLVTIGAIVLLPQFVHAEAGRWRFNGFLSQSAIYTSDNAFFGRSDDAINLDFRELALIFNGNLTQSVNMSAQLLSRKAGSADDGTPQIDYGFLNWRFYETVENTDGFMLGRVKVPYGFFNDTRESPFSRASIFLPQSVYIDRIRNSTMAADELVYFVEHRTDIWNFSFKTGYGKSVTDAKELVDTFDIGNTDAKFQFDSAKAWNLQFLADYDAGRIRFGFSRLMVPVAFSSTLNFPGFAPIYLKGDAVSYWNIFSVEYNHPDFSLTTELFDTIINFDGITVDPSIPNYHNYPRGGYVQTLFHLNAKWDVFARYDADIFDSHDKSGSDYHHFIGVPGFSRYAYDKTLGAAFRPSSDWLIRFELHRVNGTMWMTRRDLPQGYQIKRHWDLAALSAAWRF